MILLPCFSRRGQFFSFSLFNTSIIPSPKCLPTFRFLTIQKLIQTGIHKDWKSFNSVWHTQLLQMHAESLPGMAQHISWIQDNGICKVRQCQVHSTGKLLSSTKSALKCSQYCAKLRGIQPVCLLGVAGNCPKPWHKAGGTKKLLQLIPEHPLLCQPVPAAGTARARTRFGCRPLLLQTPPTDSIDSRMKTLILCHRKSLSSEEPSWDCIHGILIVFGSCRRWKDRAKTCQQQANSQPSARGCHFTEK